MILLNHNIKDPTGFNVSAKELLSIFKGLRLGQIIRGKVLDVLGKGEILALINGEKFKAQSGLNLMEGDVLFLKVISMKPNVVLQLYGIDTEKNSDPIINILRMFNLEENGLNQKVVSTLLKNNVSINKNEIQKISEILTKILNGLAELEDSKGFDTDQSRLLSLAKGLSKSISEEKLIDAMIFLQSKNIPVTTKTTLIAYNFLNNETEFSSDINNFFGIFKSIKNEFSSKDNPLLSLNLDNENIPVEKILQKIGLDYEKRISELSTREKSSLNRDITLKQIALETINNIKSFESFDTSEKLKILSMKILNNIEFQQLLNSDDSGELKNWYFQIPVNIQNEATTIELKITGKNKKSSNINKVPYNFNLSIDLSALGKVNSHGSLYQNTLSVSFYLQNNKSINIFKEDIDYLKSRFKELGFYLQSANVESYIVDNQADLNAIYHEPAISINVRA
jgi:hypothetical protein